MGIVMGVLFGMRLSVMFNFLRAALLLIGFVHLTGCSIGPDYQVPELNLSSNFVNTSAQMNPASEEALAELHWWENFKDPILNELLTAALDRNLDVRQALSRINQSRAQARKAFSELLPGALTNAEYKKAEQTAAVFPGGSGTFPFEIYTASVDALWELDIFGRLRRELESRNAEYASREAELEDVLRIVFAEISNTYIQLRATQEQLEIARRNLILQEESLKLVETQFKFGEVSELEPARARVQLANTRATVPALEAATKAHMHRLAVILGKQPSTLYEKLSESIRIPAYDGPVSISSPEALLRQRPDIRVAERRLAAQTARIGVAVGELFPKLTVSGSIGFAAPKFSDLNRQNSFYSFGPAISWAALDLGRLRADIRFSEEAAQESLFAYEQTVLSALEEVENSFVQLSAEQQRQLSLLEAEQASQKAFSIADSQYREGALDFLSVLVTQRQLLESESALVEGRKQLSMALVALYKALGGGWQSGLLQESAMAKNS